MATMMIVRVAFVEMKEMNFLGFIGVKSVDLSPMLVASSMIIRFVIFSIEFMSLIHIPLF